MKLQYVRAFIVLLAGLITLIINMKTGRSVTSSLLIVLVVLIIFYVIGTLIVEILQKGLDIQEDNESATNSQSDADDDEEETKEETIAFSFDEDEMD